MDLIIDVAGVDQAEVVQEFSDVPSEDLDVVKSTALLGDPVVTAVVHDVFHNLPAIISSLAAVLVAWGKKDALRRIVLKKGARTIKLEIRGMSGEDLHKVLESRITEFHNDEPD